MRSTVPEIHRPKKLNEAGRLLGELGSDSAVIGGGTWILRAQLRREPLKSSYVTLADVPGARSISTAEGATRVGAAVTHAQLAAVNGALGHLGALRDAACGSAHAALRNVLTLAGNVRTPLPEVDLVPAFLASDGMVEVIAAGEETSIPVAEYLATRTMRPSTEAVSAFVIPALANRRAAYERVTVMDGGGYGVATVAISADIDGSAIVDARVAIGALEENPRRAAAAEALLREQGFGASAEDLAAAVRREFSTRDGLDAPGWYRVAVLPTLFRRVLSRIVAG